MNGVHFEMHEFYVHDAYPMYVQRWNSDSGETRRPAVVLIPGGAHTGVCWTTCPDGRPGWARVLAAQGWTAFVVDWPGVGRSRRPENFLSAGPTPAVEALVSLLRDIGPALLIGHSMGAAIAVKVIEQVPHLISGFIAVAPAPPPILPDMPPAQFPEDTPIRFDEEAMRHSFTNADRFPIAALDVYRRSLCDLSPSMFNSLGSTQSDQALAIHDRTKVTAISSLVIAGDQDQLVPKEISKAVAEFLDADHIVVGSDWGLEGFGHMMPIEVGSEAILERALEMLKLPAARSADN